jgi:hypothetical protein
MIVGRLIGWLVLIAALVAEGHDLWGLYDTGHYEVSVLGKLWFEISPNTLLLAQPAIQRHVAAWLWDPVIASLLQWPAALTLGALAFLLLWVFRRRGGAPRRHRR